MKLNTVSRKIMGGGSIWLVIVFAGIAIIGAVMMFTPNSRSQQLNKSVEKDPVEVVDNQPGRLNYPGYIRRTLLITGAVLLLFFVLVKWYQKRVKGDITTMLSIDIIGRKYIAPKQYLLMVEVEDQKLLLGITDSSINLITTFNDDNIKELAEFGKEKVSNSFLESFNPLEIKHFG